jgi:ParB family transcriptional regulator, chromosome partitioning protein
MARKPENRALARGLSELMSEINLGTQRDQTPRPLDQTIAIDLIHSNALQPRKDFDPEAIKELSESIRRQGVIQPIIVRPSTREGMFEIVAGERRWRAAQLAQLHAMPAIIRNLTNQEVLEVAIIENIQRSNLNAIEEALGYKQLMENFGHTQEKLADALSKSRSHIANLLRLLSLPAEVQQMVRNGALTAGHARALITSGNPVALAATVVGKGLSVRETEVLARKIGTNSVGATGKRRNSAEKDADTRSIETDLSASLGMKVQINHEPGGETGVISIRYNSLNDLDALCQALSVVRRDILAS